MFDIIGGIVAFLLAIAGAWVFGQRKGEQKVKDRIKQSEAEAHERIENADVGIGANDSERIRRLREMADRLRD